MDNRIIFLLLLHGLVVHGYLRFDIPFKMNFGVSPLPASNFPSFSSGLAFPSIFNPERLMQRQMEPAPLELPSFGSSNMGMGMDMGQMEMMGGMDGMNMNMAPENVTTKNKTEHKDGFEVTTITSDGPGFHSYIQEYKNDANNTGNATYGAKEMKKLMRRLRKMNGKMKKQHCAKPCPAGKFCDPIFQTCRKKLDEGSTCMFEKQCKKGLKCVWGRCNKAEKGSSGTFCKKKEDCSGDACCSHTPGGFNLMCIPRQTEGAICGLKASSFFDVVLVAKRSITKSCNPCLDGLKCGNVGDSKYKRCVKESYVDKEANKAVDEDTMENKGDEDSSTGASGDESKDDDDTDKEKLNQGQGGIQIKASPKKKGSKKEEKSDD